MLKLSLLKKRNQVKGEFLGLLSQIEFLQNVKSSVRQELEYANLPNIQLDYHLTT